MRLGIHSIQHGGLQFLYYFDITDVEDKNIQYLLETGKVSTYVIGDILAIEKV